MFNDELVQWLSRKMPSKAIRSYGNELVTLATANGLNRSENQDRLAMLKVNSLSTAFTVVALADGMGGMRNGQECAVRTIAAFFDAMVSYQGLVPAERLRRAALVANDEVFQYAKGYGGATLSALLMERGQTPVILNVGDSRIYARRRDHKGLLKRLTVDDSLAEIAGGSSTALIQFIGIGDGLQPHVDVVADDVSQLLLTSDGVHFVNSETFSSIAMHSDSLTQSAERYLDVANWCGSPDNASIGLVDVAKFNITASDSVAERVEVMDPFGQRELKLANIGLALHLQTIDILQKYALSGVNLQKAALDSEQALVSKNQKSNTKKKPSVVSSASGSRRPKASRTQRESSIEVTIGHKPKHVMS